MGKLVKLLSSGVGLATEAYAARKKQSSESTPPPSSSSSRPPNAGESSHSAPHHQHHDEAPPQYIEVPDEEADRLIAQGHAVPADAKGRDEKSNPYNYDDEEEDDDEDTDELEHELPEEGDEEQWALDEASRGNDSETPQNVDRLWDDFMRDNPPPQYSPNQGPIKGRLPCPVIIPQRRPRDKKRGFVRAYAPVLENCGIDQKTFLDFLETFHASTQEDKWLRVVNVGAMVGGTVGMFVPNPFTMPIQTAIMVGVGVSMEVQRRKRTNSFLDRMNNEFFIPRGLYAMIIAFKPDSDKAHTVIDINESVSKAITPSSSAIHQTFHNLRLTSGATYSELELPEAAPLIFPALDSTSEQQKSKLKASSAFLADYYDRRAQATFAAENPGSKLTVEGSQPEFASRWADPNSAANSGGLVAMLTGGKMAGLKARKGGGIRERRGQRQVRRAVRGGMHPEEAKAKAAEQLKKKKQGGMIKKVLHKDVLYLMIVNMPTEEEMRIGRETVANEDAAGQL